jgi:hypothetical protein
MTLTYDQLQPGKRYRATVEVEHVRYEAPLKLTMWTDAAYEEIPEPPKPLAVAELYDATQVSR